MPHTRRFASGCIFCCGLSLLVTMLSACGFDRIAVPLPDLVEGLSLADLEAIQDDERLTVDEKRQAIREAVQAPNTEAGDRLVDFLLNFNVP